MKPLPLILLAAAAASAETYKIEIQVADGKESYAHALSIADGSQANFVGAVRGKRRKVARKMIFNALAARAPSGGALVQYQVELAEPDGGGESFQAQGELTVPSGGRVFAAQCGKWSATLAAGTVKQGAKTGASPGSWRFALELSSAGGKKLRCVQALPSGSQGNVVIALRRGAKRFGTIMNILPVVDEAGAASVQVQYTHTPMTAPKGVVQAQSEIRLRVGESRVISQGPDHALKLSASRP